MPTVDAIVSAEVAHNSGSGVAASGTSRNTTIGVELNLTLFAGFATRNRIAEMLLLEEKAREDLSAVRSAAAEATERAFYQLKATQAQVKALEAAEISSRASLEGTRLGFRAGIRLSLDVLNAQTLLFQTQRDLSRARYDVLLGHLKLHRQAGNLQASDLSLINSLLID